VRVMAPLDFFGRLSSERSVFRRHGMGYPLQTLDTIVLLVWSSGCAGARVHAIRAQNL
jgi:hypothetical protein